MPSMELLLHDERLAVARLIAGSGSPEWASGPGFVSVTHTEAETSVICPEERVPAEVRAERGFVRIEIPGPIPFTEVGILAAIAAPLGSAGVSIFALSTFDTDHVLLRAADVERARAALEGAGYRLR